MSTRLSITKFLTQRCGLLSTQFTLAKVDHRWHVFIARDNVLVDRNLDESCFKWIDLPNMVTLFEDFLPKWKDIHEVKDPEPPPPPDEDFEEVA